MRRGIKRKEAKQAKVVAKLTAILGRKPNTPAPPAGRKVTLAEAWAGRRKQRRTHNA